MFQCTISTWKFLPLTVKQIIRKLVPLRYKQIISEKFVKNYNAHTDVVDMFGLKFKYIPDGHFNHVLFDGIYEPFSTNLIRKFLAAGDIVIDLGANFGWFTVHAADIVGPAGKVYAVEMSPNSIDTLVYNLSLNSLQNVKVVNACIDSVDGDAKSVIMNKIGCDPLAYASAAEHDVCTIKTITLDTIPTVGPPALIKIDIEGFEVNALKGARKVLGSAHNPVLLIEFNEFALNRADSNCDELAMLLKSYGYDLYVQDGFSNKLIKTDCPVDQNAVCLSNSIYSNRFRSIFEFN